MATRYVVDTNLLVYALDRREPEKRERAREVLRRVGGAGTAALPAQVLSEFANACLRKLEPRPDPEAMRRELERLMLAFPVLALAGPAVLEAPRGVGEHPLTRYDAQSLRQLRFRPTPPTVPVPPAGRRAHRWLGPGPRMRGLLSRVRCLRRSHPGKRRLPRRSPQCRSYSPSRSSTYRAPDTLSWLILMIHHLP